MSRLREAAASDRGVTLIEVLVATAIGLFVIGAGMGMFISAVKSQPRAASHADAVQTAQTAMERMTRELRQGSSVTATPTQLVIDTYVDAATCGGAAAANAIPCRVTYTCASGACTRTVAQPDGSAPGAARTVITGLSANDVFSSSTNCPDPPGVEPPPPNFVGVSLALAGGDGRNAITLSDGVWLRNGCL